MQVRKAGGVLVHRKPGGHAPANGIDGIDMGVAQAFTHERLAFYVVALIDQLGGLRLAIQGIVGGRETGREAEQEQGGQGQAGMRQMFHFCAGHWAARSMDFGWPISAARW